MLHDFDLPPTLVFHVAGVTHEGRQDLIQKMLDTCPPNQWWLGLQREPDNKFDPNAIKVRALPVPDLMQTINFPDDAVCIGYVPASRQGNVAAKLAPILDSGWRPESVVVVAVVGEYPKLGVKVSISPDPFAPPSKVEFDVYGDVPPPKLLPPGR